MKSENEQLFYDALSEIAEHMGDSLENPISVSLMCLTLGISNEEKGKIFINFNQILREYSFEELSLELFRLKLTSILSKANEYSDEVIIGLIKAFSKDLIVELYPFSKTLD